ncbi:MAG: hypothetical protein JWR72_2037 [Flavisolibacter sp.]|nr:hypothetical protein [Flavisolibacter sp.]
MTEKLLQFIWQFGYYNNSNLTTVDGESLTVIFPGTLNTNQGPDFTAAKIKIGDTILAGTLELHTKTSEWRKHGHETDAQYKNVILHVVFSHDADVNGIPVLELESRISSLLLRKYASFMDNISFIACSNSITEVRELTWVSWKERLLAERLQRKSIRVLQLLSKSNDHWEETLWWLLAKNFGSKINGDAFEVMAQSVSTKILAKHKTSIHQIEAILFGQAGLLNDDFDDDYPKLLQREYNFLKKKYSLLPSAIPLLFLRMRPGNFPTIRLAQLAMVVHTGCHLFSKIIEAQDVADIKVLFAVTANDFWHYHYTLHEASSFKKKMLGSTTINNLIINTVVPVLFAYGLHHNEEKYKEKAIRWLESLSAESNLITKEFLNLGVKMETAFDSQALIELKNEYCSPRKCLDCSVGNYLLREAAAAYQAKDSLPV